MKNYKYLYLNNIELNGNRIIQKISLYLIQSKVMRSKAGILIFFVMSGFLIHAQQLQNTVWKGFWKPTQDSLIIDSKVDSAYVNTLTGFNLATSRYWEVLDTFYMVDIYGPISCPSTDTGKYLFEIINDSLFFYLISDSCASRSSGLDSMGLKKQTALSIPDNSEVIARYYPNPVNNELFLELNKNYQNLQFRIIDVNGKLLVYDQLEGSGRLTIDMSTYLSGIYFIELNDGEHRQIIKILKN